MEQKGKIIDFISGLASVLTIDNEIVKAKPIGKMKYNTNIFPMVGDNVLLEWNTDSFQIIKVYERKNHLIRPKVSNIDFVIIIQSVIEPNFNSTFLNKMILFYEAYVDNIIIAFSKIDLLSKEKKEEIKIVINDYIESGYKTYDTNNKNDFDELISLFKNNVILLVGNSGVGKSTFINKINPKLKLKVQEISKSLNRGKHTTTNNKIINFKDYLIVDSPGFSSIELPFNNNEISTIWHDFKANAVNCKFRNCLHISEPGCEIINLVKKGIIKEFRYKDYLNFLKK